LNAAVLRYLNDDV